MTRFFLHFWNVPATLRIWQKEPVSQIRVTPFSNSGNWNSFGPLRNRYLFYIWTALLITVHTFAVILISLHIRKYTILLHLAWLNTKMLGFTLFLLCYHIRRLNNSSGPLSTLYHSDVQYCEPGTVFAINLLGDKPFILCVSMTPPCSLSRSTTIL